MRTTLIAEPGCTPEGALDRMLRLVALAADCGFEVFKNQWLSSPLRLVERRGEPKYLPAYQWLAYPPEWHGILADACHERGMRYGCSVYLPEDVSEVAPHVDLLKVSSFEVNDAALMKEAIATGKHVVASLGMCSHEETLQAVNRRNVCRGNGLDVDLLHCCSAYPAPRDAMTLAAIRAYGLDGLSDHSASPQMGGLAVAAGARIVETHIRLDDTNPDNPDWRHSLWPFMARLYVENVREVESYMGDGHKALHACEAEMARLRVVA